MNFEEIEKLDEDEILKMYGDIIESSDDNLARSLYWFVRCNNGYTTYYVMYANDCGQYVGFARANVCDSSPGWVTYDTCNRGCGYINLLSKRC